MSAHQDIERYLGQWLELTQAEAAAIQSAKWAQVREIQSAKGALKEPLAAARKRWKGENGGLELPGAGHPLRAEIARLISLENRNADLLAAQMRRARVELESREESLRNLKRLQWSYGRKPETDWESYS